MMPASETLPPADVRPLAFTPAKGGNGSGRPSDARIVLQPWVRAQAMNVTRHAAALRPFRRAEFGNGPAAPSEGHLKVVNDLIARLRKGLLQLSKRATDSATAAAT